MFQPVCGLKSGKNTTLLLNVIFVVHYYKQVFVLKASRFLNMFDVRLSLHIMAILVRCTNAGFKLPAGWSSVEIGQL